MLSARWAKVWGDLWGNRTRTLLVVVSIAVGVFVVGMVAGSRQIILRGMADDYAAANPASATLSMTPFGGGLLRTVRRVPGVGTAEGRATMPARISTDGTTWHDLTLYALPDYHHIRLNRVWPQQGAWPPPPHQILIERASLAALDVPIGATVRVELPDGTRRALRVAGSAHDINLPSTQVSGMSYGYVAFGTLGWLGQPRAYNQLSIAVDRQTRNRAYILRIAARVRAVVERDGYTVISTVVPTPGKLWVYDAVQSMLLLLEVLGVLSLCMSGFLVVTTIAALLAQHLRQIGVMKAIGADTGQIVGMYLATVLAFCLLSLLVAVPLGVVGALALLSYSTHLLDFNSPGFSLPPDVLALELVAGVAIPLAAALVPVIGGGRMTVLAAISADSQGGGATNLERWPRWLRGLPRPVLLSLGNSLRRKGRLALTLTTLILGSAMVMSVLSVRASLLRTLDDVFGYRSYDVQITFSRPYDRGLVQREALHVPGVVRAEGWGLAVAQRHTALGSSGADIAVIAPPASSPLIRPILLRGRWLLPTDRQAVVINSDMLKDEPDLRVGRPVRLTMDGRTAAWTVVGVARGTLAGPIAYVAYPALARAAGTVGLAGQLVAVTARHDGASEARVARALETHLKRLGLRVTSTQTMVEQRRLLAANFNIIVVFLVVMAVLLAAVGGLGLMGTMSINVLERTREIGVLRAIGASDRDVLQVVMVEGLLLGLVSWLVGAMLAAILSKPLSDAVGSAFIQAPLSDTFSFGGVALWLAGVLVLAGLASYLPARRASRLTVRDVLAYE